MNPERWERIGELLEKALALNALERGQYLNYASGEDSELRREVESLLASHEEAGSLFLNVAAADSCGNQESMGRAAVRAGRRIGPYLVVEPIGHGGMGEVFAAVRADGQYRKKVAIKLVRSGYDTAYILERFRNERQILAGLDHPNIARLLDGGNTEEDVPYLVMELVEGVPIDDYCDARKLTVTDRLQLFLQVCGAVQYAHQRLVIHRDIKPSNVLVGEDGVPKLLDFGIAKILDASGSSEATVLRPMTPEYASPEQVRGEPITTATDVYSLGVVLYQLLTGHSPYRLDSHTPAKLAAAITATEPERPSTSVQRTESISDAGMTHLLTPETVSSTREDTPHRLQQRLQGDLDFMLLKALRKEPSQRYISVDQFTGDIGNHLKGLPVTARKGTWNYRADKFIRRHKTAVASGALVLLTLVSGIVVTLREARIADANRLRAEKRLKDGHRLANSLIFEVHDSIRQLPGATAARKLIIERAQQYLDGLTLDSQSDPALLQDLAAAYGRLASVQGSPVGASLGDLQSAIPNYRKAVELLLVCSSRDPSNRDILRELARGYLNLSLALSEAEDKTASKDATQKALQIMEPLARSYPADQRIQFGLGSVYERLGGLFAAENDLPRSMESYEKSLAIFQQLAKDGPPRPEYPTEISFAHKHIGSVLAVQKQYPAALDHYRAALAIDEANLNHDPGNAQTRYNITFTYSDTGWILNQQGDFDGALQYYLKALQIRSALVAADPQDSRTRHGMAKTYGYLGMVYTNKGAIKQALESYKQALAIRLALYQKDPANGSMRFEIAETKALIGKLYFSQAFRPHVSPAAQLTFCNQAKHWLQSALPEYLAQDAKGIFVGRLQNAPEILAQEIKKCELVTTSLGKPPGSSSH
ncbi:MAG: serine/threonine-protein kinase [Candidatus Acidiferrum sp.]